MAVTEHRHNLIAAAIVFLGYIFLLAVFPYWFPPDPALPNVAAQTGYNIGVAYNAAVVWTVVSLVVVALIFRQSGSALDSAAPPDSKSTAPGSFSPNILRLEILAVFAIFFLAYFPLFLARYGDFIEDKYFLSVLSRMACGDEPYGDFEFLYGPLMIYPAHYWTSLFGLSFASYYAFLALLQGSLFATLIAVLQRYLPGWKMRYLVFLLLIPPLFDVILGLNYVGWRRMLPVFAIMLVAARPLDLRLIGAAAAILGASISYSLEYGLAGLAACGGVYAVMLAPPGERMRVARSGGLLAALTIALSVAFILITTGSGFSEYISATSHVLAEASAKGLGAFRFYWTLHSLSMFALLALALVIIGAGARQLVNGSIDEGDRLLVAGFVFAVISLKIGFQRADIWHMASPFLALSVAFLVMARSRVFVIPPVLRNTAVGLIAISSASTAIGYLPMGMYYGGGLLSGAGDVLTGKETGAPVKSRRFSVQNERTNQDGAVVKLAEYLAAADRRDHPVMFYKDTWQLNHHLGVCPVGYTFYDLMYSDDRRPLRETLAANKEAYVVMGASTYRRLYGLEEHTPWKRVLRLREKLGVYLATVHYFQSPKENEIEYQMWKESLGDELVREYELEAQFGWVVVLARRYQEPTVQNGSPK